MLLFKEESYKIRGVVYKIYKEFRNYHKEKVYHNSLFDDLINLGFRVEKNKRIDVYHNGKKVGLYAPDLIVNDKIMIELKSKPGLI